MKKLLALAILVAACAAQAQTAPASAPKKELTTQQALMGTCNKEAGDLKGEERKKKVSTCLADGRKRQQEKMKACNADDGVKDKKGKERQAALSECLRK